MTLAEALDPVELEPGQVYRFRVRGLDVEVRVAPAPKKPLLSKPFCEEDVMYDAWCELPRFEPIGEVIPEPGASFLPDIPEIPQSDETDG